MPKKRTTIPKEWPYKVRRGNLTVPIYRIRIKSPKPGYTYSVAWYEGKGVRRQEKRVDFQDALELADEKLKYMASAKQAADRVNREQREAYVMIQDIAGDTPALSAIREWKKAKELTDGNLIPAAQAWHDQHRQTIDLFDVGEVIKRFLKSKKRAGIDIKASYARTFPKFQKEFGEKIITTVTSRRLQDWLDTSYDHPITRNTHRKRIVTLWSWARAQGYLPRNVQTEAELTHRAKEEAPEIGIVSADTYRSLLGLVGENHPQYLGALVLAGLCGMRRVEVHGQLWTDVNLERKFVRVSSAKQGTPAKRLITLCDSAVEWLLISERAVKEVCPGSTLVLDRIRKIGQTAGLELPPNCFRHSYISCRVAATGEIDRTALEAGTSARMIHRHYRELVTKAEGEDWFKVNPSVEIGKVIDFE